MPRLRHVNLSLAFNQKRFNATRPVSTVAVNLGSTRGIGSSSRMFYYCNERSGNPSSCINQFINVQPQLPLLIYSKNNTSNIPFQQTGLPILKDMEDVSYNDIDIESEMFTNNFMPVPSPSNIVEGDKPIEKILDANQWNDWGDDIWDGYGGFFIYNELSQQYYFPIFSASTRNSEDGKLFKKTCNVFGKTFTIIYGYPITGIWKFDISVDDPNFVFRFGMYGNLGSDSNTYFKNYDFPYSINGVSLRMTYLWNAQKTDGGENIYWYYIPKLVSDNQSKTYNEVYPSTNIGTNSVISNPIKNGLLVYVVKGLLNNISNWIINDLGISNNPNIVY